MPLAEPPITVAVAARPHPHETVSGDGWSVDRYDSAYRIALIDGLGHGPEAAAIAQRAASALRDHPALPPAEALTLCHRTLAGSRGAAISIVRFDPSAGRLTFAGIGNVEAQLRQAGQSHRPIAYRGIVGVTTRAPRAFDLALAPPWLFVLWSDGISARFDLDALIETVGDDPHRLADTLLRDWGRRSDDATVIVAASTESPVAQTVPSLPSNQ